MTLEDLRIALIELDEKRTLQLARELIAKGETAPPSILSTCQNALRVVGERYERQEYFLSALIMAGEIFRRVLELVEPAVEPAPGGRSLGTVVLGTVAGDIHDIGKNMFGTSLRAYGFTVVDLGVDVSPQTIPGGGRPAPPRRGRTFGVDHARLRKHEGYGGPPQGQRAGARVSAPGRGGWSDHRQPDLPVLRSRLVERGRHRGRAHLRAPGCVSSRSRHVVGCKPRQHDLARPTPNRLSVFFPNSPGSTSTLLCRSR